MAIFAGRRHELAFHPLVLEPQHHHNLGPVERRVEIVKRFDPEPVDLRRHQCGRRADAHNRAERLQAEDVRARDPAVQDVAADRDLEAVEFFPAAAAQRMAQRQRVEQGLGGMLVLSIPGVEHRAGDLVGDQLHRARAAVADHDGIDAHRVERHRRVDQRLALLHARLRGVHVDHVGAEPFARDFEAEQRARGVLEEGVDDRQPGEPVGMLVRLPVERDPLLGLVEQVVDLVRFEMTDPQEAAMRKSERAGRIAARGGGRRRQCH